MKMRFASLCVCGLVAADSGLTSCEQYGGTIAGRLETGHMSFNNNVWSPGEGSQCIYIDTAMSEFNVTWKWNRGPDGDPVRSYPYVGFHMSELPMKLSNIMSLTLNASWDMQPANASTPNLDAINARSDVALDLWVDEDEGRSRDPTRARQEVMIWLAKYGHLAPYGNQSFPHEFAGLKFQLFIGYKADGRQLLSFAHNNYPLKDFSLDIAAFLNALIAEKLIAANAYLGLVQFGSETFNADGPVVFRASNFAMKLNSTNGKSDDKKSAAAQGRRPSLSWVGWCWCAVTLLVLLRW